ncbi:MAG TPA: ParB/RepB/Spo0J family partition protein [Myxococcales bacterium]|nr:ParB/RepB/Spo0J family partition protein [Myxococcales bacterium]
METDNKGFRRPALGRGLAALIPEAAPAGAPTTQLPIERIQPERTQPRKRFDGPALEELAASIRERGILQPILVRRHGSDFRIIAGERRWRAAQKAGLQQVPAIIRDLGDRDAFEVALIENLQREDLDPLEEAEAFRQLVEGHGLTQEEAAARVGKDRSTVANAMRLLRLPPEVREALARGDIEMGHARALLAVREEPRLLKLSRMVVRRRLSVREVERLTREERDGKDRAREKETPSASTRREEDAMTRALGARVRIHARQGRGRIEVAFSSHEEFARLSDLLLRKARLS